MLPPNAYERKKDPEGVRSAIIDAAMAMLADKGLARLTIEGVAKAAGVTKGGLFHHFPSKDALIDGVLEEMTKAAEAVITEGMAADPEPHGSFTRAYLGGQFACHHIREAISSRALCLAMIADPKLQDRWARWVSEQVVRHAATDDTIPCAIVRLAADGIWLSTLRSGNDLPTVDPAIRSALEDMTRASP